MCMKEVLWTTIEIVCDWLISCNYSVVGGKHFRVTVVGL